MKNICTFVLAATLAATPLAAVAQQQPMGGYKHHTGGTAEHPQGGAGAKGDESDPELSDRHHDRSHHWGARHHEERKGHHHWGTRHHEEGKRHHDSEEDKGNRDRYHDEDRNHYDRHHDDEDHGSPEEQE